MQVVDLTVRPPWPSEPPRSAGPGGLVEIDGGVARRARCGSTAQLALAEAAWRGDEVLLRADADRGGRARGARPDAVRARARRRPRAVSPRVPLATRCSAASSRRARSCGVLRKPEPFEALAWAIIEQLIDTQRAGRHRLGVHAPARAPAPAGAVGAPRRRELRQRRRARGRRPRSHAVAHARARRARGGAGDSTPTPTTSARLDAIPGVGEWTLAHLEPLRPRPLRRAAGQGRRHAQRLRAGRGRAHGERHRGGVRRGARALRAVAGPRGDVPGRRGMALWWPMVTIPA